MPDIPVFIPISLTSIPGVLTSTGSVVFNFTVLGTAGAAASAYVLNFFETSRPPDRLVPEDTPSTSQSVNAQFPMTLFTPGTTPVVTGPFTAADSSTYYTFTLVVDSTTNLPSTSGVMIVTVSYDGGSTGGLSMGVCTIPVNM